MSLPGMSQTIRQYTIDEKKDVVSGVKQAKKFKKQYLPSISNVVNGPKITEKRGFDGLK